MRISVLHLFYWSIFLLLFSFSLQAQDPFFTHFYGNESFYNPALTGYKGAVSLNVKYKSQWPSSEFSAFQTGMVSFEESLPCSILDYGLSLRFDEEGAGLFRTYDYGVRFVGTIPIGNLNFKLGGTFQFTSKTVDFSRLTFSDELDPKYGTVDEFGFDIPSNFVPPADGGSRTFFTPAIGGVVKYLSSQTDDRPFVLTGGFSIHNAYSLGADFLGDVESILGIDSAKIPVRFNALLTMDVVLFNGRDNYFSLTPSLFYQTQAGINYVEAGVLGSFSRNISAGIFYHHAPNALGGNQTDWFTFALEFGKVILKHNRIDLGLAYSNNFSGLRNFVGPMLEFTLSYHFDQSIMCRNSDYNPIPCPKFSTSNKKLYENIWFK